MRNNPKQIGDKNGKYPRVDLVGETFGRLTVLEWRGKSKCNISIWLCCCVCGNKAVVNQINLRSGHTQSCGCLRDELQTKHGYSTDTKGKHPLYNKLDGMKQRCYNKNFTQYKDYGGRGIKVCDEWLNSYKTFIEWAFENGYEEGLTIERIDNDGDYMPENCCFITQSEQGNNRRNNHLLTYNGKTQNIAQWAREVGLSYATLQGRIKRGWAIEDTLFKPSYTKKTNEYLK